MRGILEFFLNVVLWFFYYHTTVGSMVDVTKIDYHNFAVNTVIFSVPYIFSGLCIIWNKEKETSNIIVLTIGFTYLLLCMMLFSCISLEFILQKRTIEDLILGIPGLIVVSKITIYNYARLMLFFPILNYLLSFLLNIGKEEDQ